MRANLVVYLVAIIGILIIGLSMQTFRANILKGQRDSEARDKETALTFANSKQMETERYVNSFNNAVARTKVMEISLSSVQALRNTERLKYLKEFEGLKKKMKNLGNGISINAVIDSIPFTTVVIPCKDSVRAFHYQLIDEWNTISAMVLDTPKFEIKVPIRSAVYWQRKHKVLWWRMGNKEWFIETFSPNKLVDITEQELMMVQKR